MEEWKIVVEKKLLVIISLSVWQQLGVDAEIKEINFQPYLEVVTTIEDMRVAQLWIEKIDYEFKNFQTDRLREFVIPAAEARVRLKNMRISSNYLDKLIGKREEIRVFEYKGGIFPFEELVVGVIPDTRLVPLYFVDRYLEFGIKLTNFDGELRSHFKINRSRKLFYEENGGIIFTPVGVKWVDEIVGKLEKLYMENGYSKYKISGIDFFSFCDIFKKRPPISYLELPIRFFYFANRRRDCKFCEYLPLYTLRSECVDCGFVLSDLLHLPIVIDEVVRMVVSFLESLNISGELVYVKGERDYESSIRSSVDVLLKVLHSKEFPTKVVNGESGETLIFYHKLGDGRGFELGRVEIKLSSSVFYMDRNGESREVISVLFSVSGGIERLLGAFLESRDDYKELVKQRIIILPQGRKSRGESIKLHTMLLRNNIPVELDENFDEIHDSVMKARESGYGIIIVVSNRDIVVHHSSIYHFGMDYNGVLDYVMERYNG